MVSVPLSFFSFLLLPWGGTRGRWRPPRGSPTEEGTILTALGLYVDVISSLCYPHQLPPKSVKPQTRTCSSQWPWFPGSHIPLIHLLHTRRAFVLGALRKEKCTLRGGLERGMRLQIGNRWAFRGRCQEADTGRECGNLLGGHWGGDWELARWTLTRTFYSEETGDTEGGRWGLAFRLPGEAGRQVQVEPAKSQVLGTRASSSQCNHPVKRAWLLSEMRRNTMAESEIQKDRLDVPVGEDRVIGERPARGFDGSPGRR